MSITLYGLGPSRSFRCLWALEEAGLDYEFISLELSGTESNGAKSTQYLALNPQGKVPTLVHDDFVLTESAAIVNYIDALSGGKFTPQANQARARQARARYDELAFFVLSELEQPLWTTGKHRFAIPEEHRVQQVLATAEWEFKKALKALNKIVQIDDFALGNKFSFADILLAQTFNWADRFKFDVPSEYLAYRDRMYQRDAAKRASSQF